MVGSFQGARGGVGSGGLAVVPDRGSGGRRDEQKYGQFGETSHEHKSISKRPLAFFWHARVFLDAARWDDCPNGCPCPSTYRRYLQRAIGNPPAWANRSARPFGSV